ncbi:prion-inhibition and propagation-domain-containing protein [Rostrohypoxylon terebratum]|nr:prion-inhibition and propagation-domain-containing protein [Rostrohypoxylon terebratum]
MEAAGLAIGVLGIAGLFTACIENFNIVVRAREFSEEFEHLCTLLALQQIRLVIWGETLGLAPPFGARAPKPYNRALERPDIRPSIETTLNQLRNLLAKADTITGRYASEEQERASELSERCVTSDSKGMTIFRDSYQQFKNKIKKNQKDKSLWQVTRWSIQDYERFERLVTNIRDLVDALESITSALGILAQQQSLLIDEIESISDASSLRLLSLVGSSTSAPVAIRAISDTASARLTYLTSSSRSYHTARTEQSHTGRYDHLKAMMSKAQAAEALQSRGQARVKSSRGIDAEAEASWIAETTTVRTTTDVPQNQRWMAALTSGRTTDVASEPEFSSKDAEYGRALKDNRNHDSMLYSDNAAKLIAQAHEGVPLARRMFLELRNIRRADIPFISAAPVGDQLDKIVACIEGPPGTPYEGGTFWIAVKIMESKPPALRFHTKIYHPNIDPRGKVCADYGAWWRDASLLNESGGTGNQRALPWFSEHVTNHYSLGSLLVALCGLLASPNINDPLVPEIAEKYLTDYEAYCEAAKLYTERFAHSERPDITELIFPEENNIDPTIEVAEYHPKPTTASLGPRQVILDSSLVWERISSHRLELSKLKDLLSQWFPDIEIVCNALAHEPWYCVALPRSLTSVSS